MTSKRMLIVDDDPQMCEFVAHVAADCGYDVRATQLPGQFKQLYRDFAPAVVVVDLAIPGVDGLELLDFLAEGRSRSSIFVMSGLNPVLLPQAQRLGAARGLAIAGTLRKPIRADELARQLSSVMP